MKNKNHTINIYVYNPLNLKEVVTKHPFTVEYVPTKKWNEYLIVINKEYCGYKINLVEIENGSINKPIRKIIAQSISNYVSNKGTTYQNRVKVYYPNDDIFKRTQHIFNTKLLNIGDFKSRDELTKFNLIDICKN